MIRLIIFDFDGTLGDTRATIIATMQDTLREKGLPEPSEQEIGATIGVPLEEGFRMSGLITEAVRHDAELREESGPNDVSADDDNNSQDNSSEVAENSDATTK